MKKLMCMLLGMSMAASLLAGCGNSGQTGGSGEQSNAAAESNADAPEAADTTEATDTVEADAAASGEQVTLTF